MKKLTPREIELICCAMDSMEEKDSQYYKALEGEYKAIREKLTYEETENGNVIRRGFSFSGCNGTEMNIFGKLRTSGYDEFYYSAPYHWAVVNVKEKRIYCYTEGDTAMIECKSQDKFKAELQAHWDFMMGNHPSALDGDSVETMRKAGIKVYWRDVKKAREN